MISFKGKETPAPAFLPRLMKQLNSSAPTPEWKGLHLPWLQWPRGRAQCVFLCPTASLPLLIPWLQVCAGALAGWVRWGSWVFNLFSSTWYFAEACAVKLGSLNWWLCVLKPHFEEHASSQFVLRIFVSWMNAKAWNWNYISTRTRFCFSLLTLFVGILTQIKSLKEKIP